MNAFQRLQQKESAAIGAEFIAPSFGGQALVCPAGVTYRVKTRGKGWGIFRLDSFTSATRLRDATQDEILLYGQHPSVRSVILVHQLDPETWLGWGNGSEVVRLCPENLNAFDTVRVVFDGWFISLDPNTDASLAGALRGGSLSAKGLTPKHREAFSFLQEYKKKITPPLEEQLRRQLSYGGGEYVSHRETPDNIIIEFRVDGQRHTASISTKFVGVSWGFCLSGEDSHFNLAGIPSVIRERNRRYDDD